MHRILQAIDDNAGICLLTGEAGTGKSLLAHCLTERLESKLRTAFLANAHFAKRADALQAILFDLGLPYEGKSEQELRLAVTDALLQSFARGQSTLLVVDEAQSLSIDVLEELRALLNLECGAGRALHIILAAQLGWTATLQQPALAAFKQRLAVHAQITPFSKHEVTEYLRHLLTLAGAHTGDLFTPEAAEVLADMAHGVPRVINQLAHQAMRWAHECGARSVDVEAVTEAHSLMACSLSAAEGTESSPANDLQTESKHIAIKPTSKRGRRPSAPTPELKRRSA
jgi:type II secretory pathway predicted ATPase ExeA